jgi:hypothetical protein
MRGVGSKSKMMNMIGGIVGWGTLDEQPADPASATPEQVNLNVQSR